MMNSNLRLLSLVVPLLLFLTFPFMPVVAQSPSIEWRLPLYDTSNSNALLAPNAPRIPNPSQYDLALAWMAPEAYASPPVVYHLQDDTNRRSLIAVTSGHIARYNTSTGALEWRSPALPNLGTIVALQRCWVGGPTTLVVVEEQEQTKSVRPPVYFIDYETGVVLYRFSLPETLYAVGQSIAALVADHDKDGFCEIYPAHTHISSLTRYEFTLTPDGLDLVEQNAPHPQAIQGPPLLITTQNNGTTVEYLVYVDLNGNVIAVDPQTFTIVRVHPLGQSAFRFQKSIVRLGNVEGLAIASSFVPANFIVVLSFVDTQWSEKFRLNFITALSNLINADVDGDGYDEIVWEHAGAGTAQRFILRYSPIDDAWTLLPFPTSLVFQNQTFSSLGFCDTPIPYLKGAAYVFAPARAILVCGQNQATNATHALLLSLNGNAFNVAFDFGPGTRFVGSTLTDLGVLFKNHFIQNAPLGYSDDDGDYLVVLGSGAPALATVYRLTLSGSLNVQPVAHHHVNTDALFSGMYIPAPPQSAAWFAVGEFAYTPASSASPAPQNARFRMPEFTSVVDAQNAFLYSTHAGGRWLLTTWNEQGIDFTNASIITPPFFVTNVLSSSSPRVWAYPLDLDGDGYIEMPNVSQNTFRLVEFETGEVLITHDFGEDAARAGNWYYLGHGQTQGTPYLVLGNDSDNFTNPGASNIRMIGLGNDNLLLGFPAPYAIQIAPTTWFTNGTSNHLALSTIDLRAAIIDGETRTISPVASIQPVNGMFAHLSPNVPVPRFALVNSLLDVRGNGQFLTLIELQPPFASIPFTIPEMQLGLPALSNLSPSRGLADFPDEIILPVEGGISVRGFITSGGEITLTEYARFGLGYAVMLAEGACTAAFPNIPSLLSYQQVQSLATLPNCTELANFLHPEHIVTLRTYTNQWAIIAGGANGILYIFRLTEPSPGVFNAQLLYSYPFFDTINRLNVIDQNGDGLPEIVVSTSSGDVFGLHFVPKNTYAPPRDVADGETGIDIDEQNTRVCLSATWRRPASRALPSHYLVTMRDAYGNKLIAGYRIVPALPTLSQSERICVNDPTLPLRVNLIQGQRYFAEVIAVYPDGGASKPAFSDGVVVNEVPQIANSSFIVSPTLQFIGGQTFWTLSLPNEGNITATFDVVIGLPQGLEYVAHQRSEGNFGQISQHTWLWTVELEPSTAATLTLIATSAAVGDYSVLAQITERQGRIPDLILEATTRYRDTKVDIFKTITPLHIWSGEQATVVLKVANDGTNPIDVQVGDLLPANMFINATPIVSPASALGAITWHTQALTATLSLSPSGQAEIVFPAVAYGNTTVENCASLVFLNAPTIAPRQACAALAVAEPRAAMRMNFNGTPSFLSPEGEITFTLTVTNFAPISGRVRIGISLPSALTLVSAPNIGGVQGAVYQATGASLQITGVLSATSQANIAFQARPTVSPTFDTGVLVCAQATFEDEDVGTCTLVTIAGTRTAIQLTHAITPMATLVGEPITLTTTFANNTSLTTTARFTIPLPPAILLSASPAFTSSVSGTFVIGADAIRGVITLTPYGRAVLQTPAIITSTFAESTFTHCAQAEIWGEARASCAQVAVLRPEQAVQVRLTAQPAVLWQGEQTRFVLALQNQFDAPVRIEITTTLPPMADLAGPPSPANDVYIVAPRQIALRFVLQPLGRYTLTIPVTATQAVQAATACSRWTFITTIPLPQGEVCGSYTALSPEDVIQFEKTASALTIDAAPNALIHYTLRVTNTSSLAFAGTIHDVINVGRFVTVNTSLASVSVQALTIPVALAPFAATVYSYVVAPPISNTILANTAVLSHPRASMPLVRTAPVVVRANAQLVLDYAYLLDGDLITFTIGIRNTGNLTATQLALRSPIATNAAPVAAPIASAGEVQYLPGERLLLWQIAALPPEASVLITWTKRLFLADTNTHYHVVWLYREGHLVEQRSAYITPDASVQTARLRVHTVAENRPLAGVVVNALQSDTILRASATNNNGEVTFILSPHLPSLVFPAAPRGFIPRTPVLVLPPLLPAEQREVVLEFFPEDAAVVVIRGMVFQDENGDGHFDPLRDQPIAHLPINFQGSFIGAINADREGLFAISVSPGVPVTITVDVPAGYLPSTPLPFALIPITHTDVRIGLTPCRAFDCALPPEGHKLIYGFVYRDADERLNLPDGFKSLPDFPLGGRVVTATWNGGEVSATTTADGRYLLVLPPTAPQVVTLTLQINASTERSLIPIPLAVAPRPNSARRLDIPLAGACAGIPVNGFVFSDTAPVGRFIYDIDRPMPFPVLVRFGNEVRLTTYAFDFGCYASALCEVRVLSANPPGWTQTTYTEVCPASGIVFGKVLTTNGLTPTTPDVRLYRLFPLNGRLVPSGSVVLRWQTDNSHPVFGYRLCLDNTCMMLAQPVYTTTVGHAQTRQWTVEACTDRDCLFRRPAEDGAVWQFTGVDVGQALFSDIIAIPPRKVYYNTNVRAQLVFSHSLPFSVKATLAQLRPMPTDFVRLDAPTLTPIILPPGEARSVSVTLSILSQLPTNTVGYTATLRWAVVTYDEAGEPVVLQEKEYDWYAEPRRVFLPLVLRDAEFPDAYEPDNAPSSAKLIALDEMQLRNFAPASAGTPDVDYVIFFVEKPTHGVFTYTLTIDPRIPTKVEVFCIQGCASQYVTNTLATAVKRIHIVVDAGAQTEPPDTTRMLWGIRLEAQDYRSPSFYSLLLTRMFSGPPTQSGDSTISSMTTQLQAESEGDDAIVIVLR